MEDINSTLLKIKALASSSPYEFERENALNRLQKLMEKHGISEQDLDDEATSIHDFKFRNKRERLLLCQIVYKVFSNKNWKQYSYSLRGRKSSNIVGIDCTTAQKIEIDFLYDFYKKLYRKEEEAFFEAFVNKHSLFGVAFSSESIPLTNREKMKMTQMMGSMDNVTPYKQIEVKGTNE